MPLASGSRFGSFDVIAPLGAGGMGEVYDTRDTRGCNKADLKVRLYDISTRRR
jgi:eukaryotic-like serine/threonine-protein kinase